MLDPADMRGRYSPNFLNEYSQLRSFNLDLSGVATQRI